MNTSSPERTVNGVSGKNVMRGGPETRNQIVRKFIIYTTISHFSTFIYFIRKIYQLDNIPQRYTITIGQSIKLSCAIEKYHNGATWRRQDGQPLPSNSQLSDGDLVNLFDKL